MLKIVAKKLLSTSHYTQPQVFGKILTVFLFFHSSLSYFLIHFTSTLPIFLLPIFIFSPFLPMPPCLLVALWLREVLEVFCPDL